MSPCWPLACTPCKHTCLEGLPSARCPPRVLQTLRCVCPITKAELAAAVAEAKAYNAECAPGKKCAGAVPTATAAEAAPTVVVKKPTAVVAPTTAGGQGTRSAAPTTAANGAGLNGGNGN